MSQEIYIELLDEGTAVWRPAQAELLPNGLFRVIGFVPEDEVWAFPPGSIVRCKEKTFSGGASGLVAYELGQS
jgi:hypothetical protein